jgi:hypothetical protein
MHHCRFFLAIMIMLFMSLAASAPVVHPPSAPPTAPEWFVDSADGVEGINTSPSDHTFSALRRLDVPDLSISLRKIP